MNSKERMNNKEKFKQMTIKEKLGYIWYYYGWQIGGTIVAIIVTVSFLSSYFAPPPPTYTTNIIMIGRMYQDYEEFDQTVADLQTTRDVDIEVLSGDWSGYDQGVMANELLFAIRLQEDKGDIFFMTEIKFNEIIKNSDQIIFAPLDNMEGIDGIIEMYETEKGINPEDNNEYIYGIRVPREGLDTLAGANFGEDLIVCLSPYAKNYDHAVETINYLLGAN
ncbi:MAG: hypothetical protein ATN35_07240 [Epulopiscium sp. Nele67-Bin004]|nr:MAG: hypothetical protein ATN35_07240 [Epulopiscium sp. Nele67-Bin004]